MPIYEYRCATCQQTIEVIQRHGEPERRTCGDDCVSEILAQQGRGELRRVAFSVTGGHVVGPSRSSSSGAQPYCGACGQNREPCS